MAESGSIAVDATVVRYPLSGVHFAVRHQALAIVADYAEQNPLLLATDPFLKKCWRAVDAPCPELPKRLTKAVWRISWQQTMLPKLLKKSKCSKLLALSYTAPMRCPVPYVLQIHDTIALREPQLCSRKNALHMRTLMPHSIKRAEQIIVPSTRVANDVLAICQRDPDDIHVVPLGIDELFLTPGSGAELPAQYEEFKPYILFVGNIEPKKGIDTLLAAYRKIKHAKEYTLLLAGQEAWRCSWLIKELDDYAGPGRIARLGYVEREHLPALYRHASVYVQPSVEEGFGLPVLEAMAMGTPVIHSDHLVLMETSGGHGLDFPVGDANMLAGVLDQARAELQAATAWARSRTWDRWLSELTTRTGLWAPDAS